MGTTRRAPEIRKIGGPVPAACWPKVGGRWRITDDNITVGRNYFDTMCDSLRHHVARSGRRAAELSRAAGITQAALDRFMAGDDDAVSMSRAARLAQLVGVRLVDQGLIEKLLDVYTDAGDPTIRIPKVNSLERRAWRRVASRA